MVAGAPGFEPGITGPKPVALPLGHAPIASEICPLRTLYAGADARALKYGERNLLPASCPGSNGIAFSCGLNPGRLYRSASASRSVAQPGSAPRSGRGGRRFKSCHSDHRFIPRPSSAKSRREAIFCAKSHGKVNFAGTAALPPSFRSAKDSPRAGSTITATPSQ
jgi:hypothetical protein